MGRTGRRRHFDVQPTLRAMRLLRITLRRSELHGSGCGLSPGNSLLPAFGDQGDLPGRRALRQPGRRAGREPAGLPHGGHGPAYSPGSGSDPEPVWGCCIRQVTQQRSLVLLALGHPSELGRSWVIAVIASVASATSAYTAVARHLHPH